MLRSSVAVLGGRLAVQYCTGSAVSGNTLTAINFVVPAAIDRVVSSMNILANEGSNVSLICNATGDPEPKVTWTVHRVGNNPQSECFSEHSSCESILLVLSASP